MISMGRELQGAGEKKYFVRQARQKQVLCAGFRKSFVFPLVFFGPLQSTAAAHLRLPQVHVS
jgi:hypothetical protein